MEQDEDAYVLEKIVKRNEREEDVDEKNINSGLHIKREERDEAIQAS
jgi:hypothetical protein